MRYLKLAVMLLVLTVGVDYLVPLAVNSGIPIVYVVRAPRGESSSTWAFHPWGVIWRAGVYLLLACGGVLMVRLSGFAVNAARLALWLVSAAAVSWAFWFVFDPIAVPVLLPSCSAAALSEILSRFAPTWAEIYDGSGFVRYFWWLTAIHGAALVGLVFLTFRSDVKRSRSG